MTVTVTATGVAREAGVVDAITDAIPSTMAALVCAARDVNACAAGAFVCPGAAATTPHWKCHTAVARH